MKQYLKSSLFFLFLTSVVFSQNCGKIYDVSKAEQLYGKVLTSKSIKSDVLISVLEKTEKVIMFTIENDNLIILGDERKVLVSKQDFIDSGQIFNVFDKSVIQELLDLGKENDVFVELRTNVLTVTCGEYTAELSCPCPPICG